MRAMKNSGIEWIGEIPESWSFIRGKFLFTERNERGNRNTLQLLSPTQKFGVIPQSLYEEISGMKAVKLDEKTDFNTMKSIYIGDFCISLRSFQGGFEYSEYDGVVSPAYHVFYKTSELCNTYYRYLFKEQGFIAKMASLTKTFRDGKSIAFSDFADSLIPVPPLPEQHRISAYLDRQCALIDSVTEKTKASIEEYKKLRQAVITQAVTKGVRGDRPMKDSGIEWIGEIPEEWRVVATKHLFLIVSGATPKSENPDYFDGNIIWITPADFKTEDKFVSSGRRNITELGLQSCNTTMIPAGSIVFSKRAPIGSVVINAVELCTNQGCLSCVPNSKAQATFYYYFMSAFTEQYNLYGSGTTFKEISANDFAAFKLTYPTLDEQQEIAAYLDKKCAEIDALITKKETFLTELEAYKKSLIYEYVTGKKEVPQP